MASVGVTGGMLVYFSGANGNVSSGVNSYVTSDVAIGAVASGTAFNGVVITPGNTASGTTNYVAVAVGGTIISTADGTVTGGEALMAAGGNSVQDVGSIGGTALRLGAKIGRAISNAASGTANFVLWQITP